VNATLAERVAELEAERWLVTPRKSRAARPKPAPLPPITESQAAANRAALLNALRNNA